MMNRSETETTMRRSLTTTALLLLLIPILPIALPGQEVGPENGSLVIVGGAMQDPAIVRRFIDLAGGPDAPIVLIRWLFGRRHDPGILSGPWGYQDQHDHDG